MNLERRHFFAAAAGLFTALAAASSLAAALTGSGTSTTHNRDVQGFKGVALAVPARMEIVQGATEGMTLTADDNLVGEIETVVHEGMLHIRWKKGIHVQRATIRIVLRARTVESIGVAGSGDVNVPTLAAGDVSMRISGSGEIRVGAGRAESLQVRISGSGDVKAGRLDTRRAMVTIAGSGDATVWARESLDVNVAGSGDVLYFGDPRINKRIAGSGSVRRAGAAPA